MEQLQIIPLHNMIIHKMN